MKEFIFIIFFIIIILSVFIPKLKNIVDEENIANYPISEAILIDNFMTYTRFGEPCYYLVYKFNDNSIKQFKVTEEQYYINTKLHK